MALRKWRSKRRIWLRWNFMRSMNIRAVEEQVKATRSTCNPFKEALSSYSSAAQAGAAVVLAVIDTAGFRFAKLTEVDDPDFLPGGAKYFDLPGMLALSAPHALRVDGEGPELPDVVRAAYRAAGAEKNLVSGQQDPDPFSPMSAPPGINR